VILVGPAGAGKTTIAHALERRSPASRGFSVSHTSRPLRQGEQTGVDYWFVTRPEFEHLRDGGAFAEWAEVHGNYYGTSLSEIARLHAAGQDILFDVDIKGAHNLWRQFPEQSRLVFVLPPSWQVLVERLASRGSETEQTLRRRLRTARRELQELLASPAPWHVVVNDQLAAAIARVEPMFDAQPPLAAVPARSPIVQAFVADAQSDPRTVESAPPA